MFVHPLFRVLEERVVKKERKDVNIAREVKAETRRHKEDTSKFVSHEPRERERGREREGERESASGTALCDNSVVLASGNEKQATLVETSKL